MHIRILAEPDRYLCRNFLFGFLHPIDDRPFGRWFANAVVILLNKEGLSSAWLKSADPCFSFRFWLFFAH